MRVSLCAVGESDQSTIKIKKQKSTLRIHLPILQTADLTHKREAILGAHLFLQDLFQRKHTSSPWRRVRMRVLLTEYVNGVEVATAGAAAGLFSGTFFFF